MLVRPETPADHRSIAEVTAEAFERPDEATLVDALRLDPGYDPELSLVAVHEGRIIGHALLTPITIEAECSSVPALALAPVSVTPEWHRQGIGTAVTLEALRRARERGHRAVIVLGHAEYYARFGFVPASRFGIRASFEVPDEAFMALELVPGALEVGGTVRYPPAFGV